MTYVPFLTFIVGVMIGLIFNIVLVIRDVTNKEIDE